MLHNQNMKLIAQCIGIMKNHLRKLFYIKMTVKPGTSCFTTKLLAGNRNIQQYDATQQQYKRHRTWVANDILFTNCNKNKQTTWNNFNRNELFSTLTLEEMQDEINQLPILQPLWQHYLHRCWQQLSWICHPAERTSTVRMYGRSCSATGAEYHLHFRLHKARHLVRIARSEQVQNDLWMTLHRNIHTEFNKIQTKNYV